MIRIKSITATSLLVISQIFSSCSFAAPPVQNDVNTANVAFSRGHYRHAAVQYQKLLQSEPDNAAYRMRLAESYEFSGDLRQAEDHAAKVLTSNRRNLEAVLLMGRIRGRQEDWISAKAYYEQAISIDKNNATSHLGLGQAFMQLGDEQSADSAFAEYRRLTGTPTP